MSVTETLWTEYNPFLTTKHMSAWINHWKIANFPT